MRGTNLLPNIIRINMNKFNGIHGEEKINHQENVTENLHKFTSNTTTPPQKIIPVVSDIMGRLNHHGVDNSDVKVYTSNYPLESTS